MRIYLCGGMHNGWQDKAVRLLRDHVVLDPRSHGLEDENAYTEWDLAAIREADALLAYMDNDNPSGFGLNFEIGYATALGKSVYLVMEHLGFRHKYFGMVRSVSHCYGSLQDAVRAMNA